MAYHLPFRPAESRGIGDTNVLLLSKEYANVPKGFIAFGKRQVVYWDLAAKISQSHVVNFLFAIYY